MTACRREQGGLVTWSVKSTNLRSKAAKLGTQHKKQLQTDKQTDNSAYRAAHVGLLRECKWKEDRLGQQLLTLPHKL